MKTSKAKKTTSKKAASVPRERTLKIIQAEELREKLKKHRKSVVLLLDDQKYSLPKNDMESFVEALIETTDLKAARKEDNVLTTQEVADLLNVSRPFVVKLIETNQLKAFNVGTHRRVLEVDAMEFRRKMRQQQNEALDEMAREAESLGLNKFE